MQLNKVVVLDHGISELMGNKIFNPSFAKKISHTILPTCFLYQEALKKGIRFITPDVFLNFKGKPQNTLLITHLKTPYTGKLISLGAKPTILTCQESPFIATRFYMDLKRISGLYKHTFVFSGMKKRLSSKTTYHQMFFPQPYDICDFKPIDFNKKKFLAMIISAKSIKDWKKKVILKLMYGLSVKEIYSERIEAIKFFSEKNDFDLFGFGWDRANFDELTGLAVKKVYRGTVEDKLETLRNYKIALCFENAVFNGYITEKIFDAMFAGTVPIYYGAPDVEKYIPKETFINFKNFANYQELDKYLRTLSEKEYNKYLNNIKNFLSSRDYFKFSQEYFTEQVLDILSEEFSKI